MQALLAADHQAHSLQGVGAHLRMELAAGIPALLAALISPVTMTEQPVANSWVLKKTHRDAFFRTSQRHNDLS